MPLYSDKVMENFINFHNVGEIKETRSLIRWEDY